MRHLLLLIPAIIAFGCNKSDSAVDEQAGSKETLVDAFHVRTAPVVHDRLEDIIHGTGVIMSETDARPSFKTGGVIAKTFVEEGDRVRKGQMLAQLNLTEIQAQATQAQYALDKAKRDNQRMQNLYADSIVTLEQVQNSQTAVEVAEKTLQIAEFNVSYSEVRSPIDGKVISQMLHEGEVTGPGIPIYYIMGVKQSDWNVVVGLTDKNWSRVKAGDSARIHLDAYSDEILTGKVIRLSDVANPQSGTFDVEIGLPGRDIRLAAGLIAHVEIMPSSTGEFPFIPIEALVSSNGRKGVVYVPENGQAVKKRIQIRKFLGERIAVQSGLDGIDTVITAGSSFLEDGDRIIIE